MGCNCGKKTKKAPVGSIKVVRKKSAIPTLNSKMNRLSTSSQKRMRK